jgi:tRNA(fMet)-specific endonuclease VapC
MIFADTSAVIALLRGNPPPQQLLEHELAISCVVELELYLGVFHKGGDREMKRVQKLLEEVELFPFDSVAASETAKIMAELWKKGEPIGDFDCQIAGHAISLEMPLVTANIKHFARISQLELIDWNQDQ